MSIVSGQAESTSAFLSNFGGGRAFPHTQFYGLVDTGGRPDEAEARRGQEILQRRIQSSRESLTGTMSQAVGEVRRKLVVALAPPPDQERPWASVTCVALRDEEVYVARSGVGTVLRYYHGEIWQPDSAPASAGGDWLDRFILEPGESLVVGTHTLDELLEPLVQPTILAARPDEAARRVYLLGRGLPLLAVLFLQAERA